MKTCAIIPAAGSGKRMGGSAKHLLTISGKPILAYSLDEFARSMKISGVIIAAAKEMIGDTELLSRSILGPKLIGVIEGGVERQDSVWNCLKAIQGDTFDIVLVHDAARPFITAMMIDAVLKEAERYGGAIVAVPSKDTIKLADEDGFVGSTIDRAKAWNVQTTQAFRFDLLTRAFEKARHDQFIGTDE
ncbi:MAG TPA: IspD/TarI family cytidylyltransferase, partial [Bacteroidota bacterium]|nr:IspD/TarI family cytidylyltransferase [Bacteroidota bacterium]